MRKRAIVFLLFASALALGALLPATAFAAGPDQASAPRQHGENRWVPSFAISGGAYFQKQKGWVDSVTFEDGSSDPIPLQGSFDGDDFVVAPFVSAELEIMTPAFDIPTRPRIFLGAEILPSFASQRSLALDGDPDCIRGPEPFVPCAKDEDGSRQRPFGEDSVNGEGSYTKAEIDTLAFGANLGVAFPVRVGKRQLRIKPSVAWINYKVDANGLVVDAACDPAGQCTDVTIFGFVTPGFLRETILEASDSKRFNGIGPRFDVEMDAARWGPIGAALYIGGGAYYVLGDREIKFSATKSYDDQLGMDVSTARFKVEVDEWLFRAHVGIRFQWLGSAL